MSSGEDPRDDPRLLACVEMIRRTGASEFQLRYSDDEEPVIWMAVAKWAPGARMVGGRQTDYDACECAAALSPLDAATRLAEHVCDGGECRHCGRPTGLTPEWRGKMPMDEAVCWYRYDPELETFRRACEGSRAA